MPGMEEGANGLAGLVVVIAGAVAAGAKIAWIKHKEHVDAAHLAKVIAIDKLWKKCLQHQNILDINKKIIGSVSLPPIYEFDNNDHPATAQSIHLTEAFLDDIENITPTYPDPHLAPAFRSLLNALNYLRELLHEEEDDIALSAICYMMMMIAIHCINFTGTEKNIAYITALINFANEFASLHKPGHEPTEAEKKRYEHLTLVYGELKHAGMLLDEHLTNRSHEELVAGLLPNSTNIIEKMIKILTKMSVKKSLWRQVDATTMQRLATNVIKPRFVHDGNYFVRLFRAPRATVLDDSPFQKWIDDCAINFLLAETISSSKLDDDLPISNVPYIERHKRYSDKAIHVLTSHKNTQLTAKQLKHLAHLPYFTDAELSQLQHTPLTEAEFIKLADKGFFSEKTVVALIKRGLHEGVFKTSLLSKKELEELKHVPLFSKMLIEELEEFKNVPLTEEKLQLLKGKYFTEKEMGQLRILFAKCENYFTLEPKIKDFRATHDVTAISDDEKIIERAKFYSDYASLINKMTLLNHYGFYLWNRVKQLGEVYISNPHHCNFIFEVLTGLGRQVSDDAKKIFDKIVAIDTENERARVMHAAEHLRIVKNMQNYLGLITGTLTTVIHDITNRHKTRLAGRGTEEPVDLEKDKIMKVAAKIKAVCRIDTANKIKECGAHAEANLEEKEVFPPINIQPVILPVPVVDIHRLAPNHDEEKDVDENHEITKIQLDAKLNLLREEILKLPRGTQKKYCLELYNNYHSIRNHIEHIDEQDRNAKAADMRCLMMEICKDTLQFLHDNNKPDRKERRMAAEKLAENIHDRFKSAPFTDVIDAHANITLRLVAELVSCALIFGFVNAYIRGGFLRTESRVEANRVEAVTKAIVRAAPAA